MKEYIDREAIMEDINDLKQSPWYNDDTGFGTKQARQDGVKCVVELIINPAPIEDVAEVRHGEWINHNTYVECSLCGAMPYNHSTYCPECGAKMDGKKGDLV